MTLFSLMLMTASFVWHPEIFADNKAEKQK